MAEKAGDERKIKAAKEALEAREAWLEQFKAIRTRTDAELFTVEAKLLLWHDIDFKRPRRTGRERSRT